MNHDSSQATSEEVSITPWETIDGDEPAAVSADERTDRAENSSTQNSSMEDSSTGALPVVESDAHAAVITDPFDPGEEPSAEAVPPVPSPTEANAQRIPILVAENRAPETQEPPVGAPAALATESPLAQESNINPASDGAVGSALRTASLAAEEEVRTADPTSVAADIAPTETTACETTAPALDEDLAQEAAVPAVIEAKSFFAQSIVDADVPSDQDDDEAPILEPEPVWEDPEMADAPPPQLTGASWTIPLLCAGIGLIACCIVIPQTDANRRLAYEKMTLQADLESVQKQVAVNDQFLKKVVDDPSLAERLAQRQLKRVRKGQRVLRLKEEKPQMSPFQITNVAPPPAPPPYKPIGGILATLCYDSRTRLYLMGLSMAMIACGLVMGATPGRKS